MIGTLSQTSSNQHLTQCSWQKLLLCKYKHFAVPSVAGIWSYSFFLHDVADRILQKCCGQKNLICFRLLCPCHWLQQCKMVQLHLQVIWDQLSSWLSSSNEVSWLISISPSAISSGISMSCIHDSCFHQDHFWDIGISEIQWSEKAVAWVYWNNMAFSARLNFMLISFIFPQIIIFTKINQEVLFSATILKILFQKASHLFSIIKPRVITYDLMS